MMDQNADTEWNDILRARGIIPPKPKPAEDVEDEAASAPKRAGNRSGQAYEDMNLQELGETQDDAIFDELDHDVVEQFRQKRMQEMREAAGKPRFGEVREISANDYIAQVNNAGKDIWVVLLLLKPGIPLCTLISDYINILSRKFPYTKFLKAVSTTCVPNFPDSNLPAIFVYYESDLKQQLVGPFTFGGMQLTCDALEWILSETKALTTTLEEDPRKSGQMRRQKISGIFSAKKPDSDEDSD